MKTLKELCYHIAMNTRIMGEAAARRGGTPHHTTPHHTTQHLLYLSFTCFLFVHMRGVWCVVCVRVRVRVCCGADLATLDLTILFLNTFLRMSINAKDVRTVYNCIYQYRKLAEAIIGVLW